MKKKLLFISVLFLFSVNCVYAVPAYPYPINIVQPDGTSLTILLKGDEHFGYNQSTDGYLITRNQKGYFEYADVVDNKITPMGVRVNNIKERTLNEIKFLKSISKKAIFQRLEEAVELHNKKYEKKEQLVTNFPSLSSTTKSITGNKRILCILIGFPDRPFTRTQTEFNNLMNQVGYNENTAIGSVRDYYLENSYSQLSLDITVVGPYIADHNMSYYGENIYENGIRIGDIRPRDLIKEALNKANPDINFGDFDNNNDGKVDGVHIIYAGYSEAAGGNDETIWPHKWSLSSVSYDGKEVNQYSCSAELRNNWGTQIDGIGTACHEIGHILGSPDFYDTNNDGIDWTGTGNWDLMSSGSWNSNGDIPAHFNPYIKTNIFGWAGLTVLPSDNTLVTLNPASINKYSFYRINTPTPNEYFILENRQHIGFDSGLPGHGMLVYHVHSQINSSSQSNNITHPQKLYPICASSTEDPTNNPVSYGAINSAGCPFPGTANRQTLNNQTTPSLISWAGAGTGKDIQFIQEVNNNITFIVNPQFFSIFSIDYNLDCSQKVTITRPANLPIVLTGTSNLRFNGNTSPYTLTGNTVTISSINNMGGTVNANNLYGSTIYEYNSCSPWAAVINGIWTSPKNGEPLQAEVYPPHPEASEYRWYVNNQMIEKTYDNFLSTYNWPCNPQNDAFYVMAITENGSTVPIEGTYFPLCSHSYFSITPNPSSSFINISPSAENNTARSTHTQQMTFDKIVISDVMGNVKFQQTVPPTSTYRGDVSRLSNGIYYLNLYNNGKIIEKKTIQISK